METLAQNATIEGKVSIVINNAQQAVISIST
jgi:hypothetical protein